MDNPRSSLLHTPVLFLVFNRPDYTERVFAEIARARPSKLLVVADGPRNDEEAVQCEQTRAIIRKVDWECEVLTNFSDINLGCRRRVSSGIDWAFSQVEEAIILEDDCLPHPDFFPFCQALLDRYRHDERVMMISGTNFLVDKLDVPETYVFSQYPSIWGWATWRRAWNLYDVDMTEWPRLKAEGQVETLIRYEPAVRYYLQAWDIGIENTWDYQWSFARRFNNGLGAVPRTNLVTNFGITGTHDMAQDPRLNAPTFPLPMEPIIHPKYVFPDQRLDKQLLDGGLLFGVSTPPSVAPIPLPIHRRVLRKLKAKLKIRLYPL